MQHAGLFPAKLEDLDLSYNELTDIPNEIFDMVSSTLCSMQGLIPANLTTLRVRNNNLSDETKDLVIKKTFININDL